MSDQVKNETIKDQIEIDPIGNDSPKNVVTLELTPFIQQTNKNPDLNQEKSSVYLKPQPLDHHQQKIHPCRGFWGLGIVLLMNIVAGFVVLFVKVLKDDHHPVSQVVWLQMVVVLWAIGGSTYMNRDRKGQIRTKDDVTACDPERRPHDLPPTPTRLYIYLGLSKDFGKSSQIWTVAILFGLSSVFKAWSLMYLTIGDATSTGYLSIFTCLIFGHFLLEDEPLKVIPLLAGLLILFGVVIIAKPPFLLGGTPLDWDIVTGISFSAAYSITFGLYFVLHRRLRSVHFSILNVSQSLATILISLGFAVAIGVISLPRTGKEVGFLVGMGVLSYGAQVLRILAVKVEKAYLISLYRPTDIVISMGLQMVFLGQNPSLTSILGSTLILICVVLMVLRKILSIQPEGSWSRRWFGWFLL